MRDDLPRKPLKEKLCEMYQLKVNTLNMKMYMFSIGDVLDVLLQTE